MTGLYDELNRWAPSRRADACLAEEEYSEMPGKKHLRGVGPKEQRMYEHIVKSAEKMGLYGKRSKEVAARTVLKHHQEEGHQKGH
jgi:hypothetical protein